LVLTGPLADKVVNTPEEMQQEGIIFAKGFGAVTDLQISPYDGYLYVVSSTAHGKIYRITPSIHLKCHDAASSSFL
jgi:hypothetical protein